MGFQGHSKKKGIFEHDRTHQIGLVHFSIATETLPMPTLPTEMLQKAAFFGGSAFMGKLTIRMTGLVSLTVFAAASWEQLGSACPSARGGPPRAWGTACHLVLHGIVGRASYSCY